MADQLSNFLRKFQEVWQAGKDARLFLECHAGQAVLNLHVRLEHPLPPPQQHHHHHRRPGPSRLRRRARRAAARAAANAAPAAAKAASEEETTVATAEMAVQTDNVKKTSDIAVQADVPLHHPQHVPRQAIDVYHPRQAGPAVQDGLAGNKQRAVEAQPCPQPTIVRDAFCQDRDYWGAAQAHLHHPTYSPHHPQAVRDVFCPDQEYRLDDQEYAQNRENARRTLEMIDKALNYSKY